jgi:hypothetical protein
LKFNERLSFIDEKIFKNPIYSEFYNIKHNFRDKKQCEDMTNRWIGIKNVGKPHKNEHLKFVLDAVNSFLVHAKDFSSQDRIEKFMTLVKNKNKLNHDEKIEFDNIKNEALYCNINKKNNIVLFLRNRNAEFNIKNNIIKFNEIKHQNATNMFMFKNLINRYVKCIYTVSRCIECADEIKNLKKNMADLKYNISSMYDLKI